MTAPMMTGPRTLFVVPTTPDSPATAVALGLVRAFERAGHDVGYVRPVDNPNTPAGSPDPAFRVARVHCGAAIPDPLPARQAEGMIRAGAMAALLDAVVQRVEQARRGHALVVVEGPAPMRGHPLIGDLDRTLGRNLAAEVIPVVPGDRGRVEEVVNAVADAIYRFGGADAPPPAQVIVTPAPGAGRAAALRAALDAASLASPCLVLPSLDEDRNGLPITDTLNGLGLGTGPSIPAEVRARVARHMDHLADLMAPGLVMQNPTVRRTAGLTPPMFRYRMVEAARDADRRIVLPEGEELRTLKAAVLCAEQGIARCVLLGDPATIRANARAAGLTVPDTLEIVDPTAIRARYVAPLVALRKSMTPERAEQALQDTVVLGTMMLAEDDVDGLVSGAVHTTADTVRPALQLIRTAPGASLVSSVFFMLMPDQVLVYGDCAINPDPTAEQLAEIAIQSADSAATFGIEPRVAMISYSTGTSGQGDDVDKVRIATALVRQRRPDLLVDGPLQYDAATVASVARSKAPDSPVAGRATVFVFPDLNTGNCTYKAVQRAAHVVSVGPLLQGLRKPVNDLSRGALVDDIVYTIALTALQAGGPRRAETQDLAATG
ncbi:phosphate acetyltransferase [Roseospira marina]|uniref:Phosphate acetyltransferase n=1 Tax=Roseospira marina TaxID=140057 RepID=A0A5M6ICF5_9PROT|nr:phosphate acetyltransferase [Roseospira marina]KAA5605308.1 phosphate acetyltransferase [Roseospira marina]MBB4314776.1 phosphate acetyltransferase [Roseospira marina]MBB5087765.1 phosphate acetyltransferase [Roseospira marina]